jgi:hypothetical protein
MRNAGKPLIPVLRAALKDEYGSRGGLADRISKAPARVTVRTGETAGIVIVFKGVTVKLGELKGRYRHPVFPDPDKPRKQWHWVTQEVPENTGMLAKTARENVSKIMAGVEAALNTIVDRVVAGG